MRKWTILLTLVTAPAAAQESGNAPTLTNIRYDEDWSILATPASQKGRWTEPYKYIALDDEAYLTTGLELRIRSENYRANLWGDADVPDDSYLWVRASPYADLHIGRLRSFVQPIAAYAIGVAPSAGPVDQTSVDLLQGFVDVRLGNAETGSTNGTGVTIRAGRQMLSLGTERLVGTRYGPNVPLAFDGLRGLVSISNASISLLAVKPVQPGLGSLDDRRSRTKTLWGAYATLPSLEIYYLGYRNSKAKFGARAGRELRHSIGARSFGNSGHWHWNIEGVAQFGQFAGGSIAAWTLGTEIGRRFPKAIFAPDFAIRFNIVSGDANPGDNQLGTFNALFPKGKYFGELSPVGPVNIVSFNPRIIMAFSKTVSADFAAMAYWRYSRSDGVYDVPGNLIRPPGTARSRFIGKEVEATLAWQATPELELSGSLSAFSPGAYIADTGSAKTIALLGLESKFRF